MFKPYKYKQFYGISSKSLQLLDEITMFYHNSTNHHVYHLKRRMLRYMYILYTIRRVIGHEKISGGQRKDENRRQA
jgi:hypothetical protein